MILDPKLHFYTRTSMGPALVTNHDAIKLELAAIGNQ